MTHTVAGLKKMISSYNIKGYSKLKKPALIDLMTSPQHINKFRGIKARMGKPARNPTHKMPNGTIHTGKTHTKDSKVVSSKKPRITKASAKEYVDNLRKNRKSAPKKAKIKATLKSSKKEYNTKNNIPALTERKGVKKAVKTTELKGVGGKGGGLPKSVDKKIAKREDSDEPLAVAYKKKVANKPKTVAKRIHGGQIESYGMSKKEANKKDPLELFGNLPEELLGNILRQKPNINNLGEYMKDKFERDNVAYGKPKDAPTDVFWINKMVREILFYGRDIDKMSMGTARERGGYPKYYKNERRNIGLINQLLEYYLSNKKRSGKHYLKPSELPAKFPADPKATAILISQDVPKIFSFKSKKKGREAMEDFYNWIKGYKIQYRKNDFIHYQVEGAERIMKRYPNANVKVVLDHSTKDLDGGFDYEHYIVNGVDVGKVGGGGGINDYVEKDRDKRINEVMNPKKVIAPALTERKGVKKAVKTTELKGVGGKGGGLPKSVKKPTAKKTHMGQVESYGVSKSEANKLDVLKLFGKLPEDLTKKIMGFKKRDERDIKEDIIKYQIKFKEEFAKNKAKLKAEGKLTIKTLKERIKKINIYSSSIPTKKEDLYDFLADMEAHKQVSELKGYKSELNNFLYDKRIKEIKEGKDKRKKEIKEAYPVKPTSQQLYNYIEEQNKREVALRMMKGSAYSKSVEEANINFQHKHKGLIAYMKAITQSEKEKMINDALGSKN